MAWTHASLHGGWCRYYYQLPAPLNSTCRALPPEPCAQRRAPRAGTNFGSVKILQQSMDVPVAAAARFGTAPAPRLLSMFRGQAQHTQMVPGMDMRRGHLRAPSLSSLVPELNHRFPRSWSALNKRHNPPPCTRNPEQETRHKKPCARKLKLCTLHPEPRTRNRPGSDRGRECSHSCAGTLARCLEILSALALRFPRSRSLLNGQTSHVR